MFLRNLLGGSFFSSFKVSSCLIDTNVLFDSEVTRWNSF